MKIKEFFQYHFEHPNYLYFLISLVLMLILPAFAPIVSFGERLMEITLGLVTIMACIYTSRSYRDLLVLGVLGITFFSFFILYAEYRQVSIFNPIASLLFFGLIFIRLMQFVFQPKSVSINDIFALSAGYLVLGVIASPFFFIIDLQFDQAFTLPDGSEFYEYLYFSYITLTGVGYGDIAPIHPIAKSMTMVVGIFGQLYLAVLAGIIIGKYISVSKSPDSDPT